MIQEDHKFNFNEQTYATAGPILTQTIDEDNEKEITINNIELEPITGSR